MNFPKGHELELLAQQDKRERQERCNIAVDAIVGDLRQPYDTSVRRYIYAKLDYPNKVIRDALGRHTNKLAYLHLIIDGGVVFRMNGTAVPITDRMIADTQARIDNWDQVWRLKTEAEIQRRKNRDENYQGFLEKAAKKLKRSNSPIEQSEVDKPAIASPPTPQADSQRPVKSAGVNQPKRRRVLSLKRASA